MLLLCSHTEGLPMVLIEAMRNGLPAVSTDCLYGPADIIKDGENGFLVPRDDDEAFVDAVSVLIRDDMMRKEMGRKALETSAWFSREVIIRRWIELFVKR
jgi:glycosyltransferase involved in cell wall biosynthesis